jgi:hypothetical protein
VRLGGVRHRVVPRARRERPGIEVPEAGGDALDDFACADVRRVAVDLVLLRDERRLRDRIGRVLGLRERRGERGRIGDRLDLVPEAEPCDVVPITANETRVSMASPKYASAMPRWLRRCAGTTGRLLMSSPTLFVSVFRPAASRRILTVGGPAH